MPDSPTPRLSPDELVKRWTELVQRFDVELRDAGLTDEQREQLVKKILEDDSTPSSPTRVTES